MSWLAALESELRACGIPRARRRRILAELADHLACDPEARLGDPSEVARRFADELGTVFARRAALGSFLALVPLGVLFVALFAVAALYTTSVAAPITAGLVLGTQLAFVGGTLGMLRAWRTRRARVVTAGDARALVRRAALGVAGGAMTEVALAFATLQPRGVQWTVPELAYATVVVGAVTSTAAAALTLRAARLHPAADGAGGDLASDLGVAVDPWRIAVAVALAITCCIALAGVVQSDPIDGLVRAACDGLLCLAGFALLGRPLGLRS